MRQSDKSTTIRLSWDTYHKLKARKRGGITFDEMISRKFNLVTGVRGRRLR